MSEIPAGLAAALKGAIVCYTKCWPCQFNEHDGSWHTWADIEDVAHAAATGQADPSDQQCGCYCQRSTATPTPPPQDVAETSAADGASGGVGVGA